MPEEPESEAKLSAERYDVELGIARDVQQDLMSPTAIDVPYAKLAFLSKPCRMVRVTSLMQYKIRIVYRLSWGMFPERAFPLL